MPKRKPSRNREELLGRWIRVDSVSFSINRRAEKRRGEAARYDSSSYLELRGEADEPLGEARRFVVHVHIEDREFPGPSIPPAIGVFLALKPEADAIVSVDTTTFDRLWGLATANLLRHCWLAFTQPYRRSSLIVSTAFTSEPEESSQD